MFCPADSRVNGTDVTWRCVAGDGSAPDFETSWPAAADAATKLAFRFGMSRPPHRRAAVATLSVRNIGTEAVDGWSLEFSAHFVFALEGRYTYYTETIGAEARVPFVPLLAARVARHAFFRLPGANPLQPGTEDEFHFELKAGLTEATPTLDWANSLGPTASTGRQ